MIIAISVKFSSKIIFLRFMYSHPIGNARKAKILKDTNKYSKPHLILLLRFHLYSIFESRYLERYGEKPAKS